MIDLSTIDTVKGANEGFDVKIYHPGTGKDLDIVIRVLGKDSDEFRKVSRAQQKRLTEKATKGGFRSIQSFPEDNERNGLELLAACTVSWSGVVINGEEVKCSKESAVMVYERWPFIKEQVDVAIGDRANFIQA